MVFPKGTPTHMVTVDAVAVVALLYDLIENIAGAGAGIALRSASPSLPPELVRQAGDKIGGYVVEFAFTDPPPALVHLLDMLEVAVTGKKEVPDGVA